MEYIEREAATRAVLIADCEDVSINDVIKVTGEVAEAIKKIPAADVAPVVRCKDCLSYDKANRLCTLFFHEMYEDDFCSRRAPRL